MSTTTTTTHLQPRRRAAGSPQSPPCIEPKDLAVRKGSTFHQPKLPASPIDDPVINFKTLPSRSLTSPQDLEDLVSESDKRVDDIIASFDRSLSGIGSGIETSLGHEDKLPVPSSIAAHVASKNNLMVFDGQSANKASINREATSVYKPLGKPSFAARPDRALSDYAAKVIKLHIIDPIVEEESLKDFHLLVKGLPQRIGAHQIRCLRDLEKVLIFLAPHTAKSAASYLDFCEVSIQCIHTTVDHLNELDLRRPTDRPYTNNYFVDLVEQVRQYARIMANSRQKKLKGQPLDNSDIQPGEKILLRGGVAEGKPVELVRERDGKFIPIEGANVDMDEDMLDDDVQRSMARKRKCDIGKVEYRACRECGKVYTRPCDLTKHEKTHSRPWKCTDSSCKYYELGWPTEKERDRHMNDKHSSQPALYQCLWKDKGCAYTSKRESNCKQHMEKAHGWDYIRSKSKKGTKLTASAGSPIPQLMPTPGSERYSTPASTVMSNASPAPIFDGTSPADSTTSGYGSMSSYQPSTAFAPSPASSEPVFSFNDYNKNFSYNGFLSPTASEGRRDSTNGSTGFVPEVSLPPTFEQDFNFNNLNYDWSTLGDCFPQYNIPQQPTPVTSDFELDFDLNKSVQSGSSNDFSPAPQDLMLFGQGDILMQESQGFADFASGSKSGQQASNDFTLFGEVPSGQTSHDVSAAMFPDLEDMSTFAHESTAGMFDQMSEEEMDRYLYGDGN